MSQFSTAHFVTKLSTLHSSSPPSQIQALAAYLSPLHPHAVYIAQAWQQQFISSSSHRQLSLLYLINELLHTAKRQQQSELLSVLGDVLPPCLLLLWGGAAGDDKVRERVRRLVDVWRSRHFFSEQWDDEMRQRVGLPPPEKVEKGHKAERREAEQSEHKRKRRDSEPASPPATAPPPPVPSPPAAAPALDDPVISLLTELHQQLVEDEAAYERVQTARTGSMKQGEEDGSTAVQEAEAALMLRLRRQLERRERLLLLLHDSIDSQQAAIAQLHSRIQQTLPLQQPPQRPASHLPTSVLIPLPYVPPPAVSANLTSPATAAAASPTRALGRGGGGGYGQLAYGGYGGSAVMHGFMNGAAGVGAAGGIPFRS